MKRVLVSVIALFLVCITGCKVDDTINIPLDNEVNDFIWKGLNRLYFWQADVPNLADDRFANQDELNTFLNNTSNPEDLFDELLLQTDRFSWIVDDFIALEQRFQGVFKSNGVEFGLVRLTGSNDVLGYVRYILPNSNASTKDIKRGDLFLTVDGQQLTVDNFRTLLFSDATTYTLGFAAPANGSYTLTGETITLTKEVYTENPVFMTKTFDFSGKKIGYLVYNAFTSNFDGQLNEAFGQLKADGVTDLVLDLRYNGGGSVRTATYLSSMITGQFTGQLFSKERWNAKLQEAIEDTNPSRLVTIFPNQIQNADSNGNILLQEPINSLHLSTLYILVTGNTASASELVINGLNPYINVKLIGTKTVGKYVASITLYDSENFGRSGANQNHAYAMQPIVLEELNKLDENDTDGFDPTILFAEDLNNLGILGNEDEPLLQRALEDILGVETVVQSKTTMRQFTEIGSSKSNLPLFNEMYLDKSFNFNELKSLHANR